MSSLSSKIFQKVEEIRENLGVSKSVSKRLFFQKRNADDSAINSSIGVSGSPLGTDKMKNRTISASSTGNYTSPNARKSHDGRAGAL